VALNRVWIPSPNYSSRGSAVRLIVLHTAEGATTYQSLGNYFKNPSAGVSSQVGIDDTPNTVGEYVSRSAKAWTQANANPYSTSAELCAFASWTPAQWQQHPTMLSNTAQWIKEEAAAFGIPIRKLTAQQAQGGQAGVCQHVDLGASGGGHWDCGPSFPMDQVIQMALGGAPAPGPGPTPPTPEPPKLPPGLNALMVGMAGRDGGYWQVGADGGVFCFGSAGFFGSLGGKQLNAPVVGMAATKSNQGYWMVAADGGVFCFGDAGFFGSTGGMKLNAPIVGMARTPSGGGYWLVASDGGVFCFGDAKFYGSLGGKKLNQPVCGIASVDDGYALVAKDGGVFSFNCGFYGSAGGSKLNAPVVGIAGQPGGYTLVASDGGVFAYGSAGFYGSAGGKTLNWPICGMALTQKADGYWLAGQDGGIFTYGKANFWGAIPK
jgi:N-acetylmuramoyl-L-alanine amidase